MINKLKILCFIGVVGMFSCAAMELDDVHDSAALALRFCALIDQNNHTEVEVMVKRSPQLANVILRDYREFSSVRPLHIAAFYGHAECTKILFQYNADPNGLIACGYTPLHCAQTKEIAKVLLNARACIKHKNNFGRTPLGTICFSALFDRFAMYSPKKIEQFKEVAQLLVDRGADINAVDNDGYSALHMATLQQSVETLRFLLKNNADTNMRNKKGLTAFDIAIQCHYDSDDRDKAKEILDEFEKYGMLYFAHAGPLDFFKFPSGEDVLKESNNYREFLHTWVRLFMSISRQPDADEKHATQRGITFNRFGCIVNSICEEDLRNTYPQKAEQIKKTLYVHCGIAIEWVKNGDYDELEKYIQKYPWVMTHDVQCTFSLFSEAIKKEETDCLKLLLLSTKIDTEDIAQRSAGKTSLLHLAIAHKNIKAFKFLIGYGIDLLQRDKAGRAPMACSTGKYRELLNKALCRQFAYAFDKDDYTQCKLLLAEIVDCDVPVIMQGETLLGRMVDRGDAHAKKFITLLIAKGANVNRTYRFGLSILWRLLLWGEGGGVNIFEMLLKAGAKVNVWRGIKSASLVRVALDGRLFELTDLFVRYGAIVDKRMIEYYADVPKELTERLRQVYDQQRCCICLEHPDDLDDIPCTNKHSDFLCITCCKIIKACPLCLKEFVKNGK